MEQLQRIVTTSMAGQVETGVFHYVVCFTVCAPPPLTSECIKRSKYSDILRSVSVQPVNTDFFLRLFAAVSLALVAVACNVKSATVQTKLFTDSIVRQRNEGGIPERFVYGVAVAND